MPIPQPTEFLLGQPLYAPITYDKEEVWDVLDVLYFGGTYDSFCVKCRRESTFRIQAPTRPKEHTRDREREKLHKQHGIPVEVPEIASGVYALRAVCTRVDLHKQDFLFFADHLVQPSPSGPPRLVRTFQKIGQQPSFGDLHILQVKKYSHVLAPEQLGELTRAIGLASHDVGVGAYVYLRRIFEGLVDEAHQDAVKLPEWDEDLYNRSRMSEKIKLLKAQLPSFLVEQPSMYSLLSKGVHELSEAECLKHFGTLRLGIELILDERLERRERERKIADAKAAIDKAVGEAGA